MRGLELRELVYGEGLRLPRHAHPTAGFCLVLDGSYAERYARRTLTCAPSTVTFSPAGEEHANVFAGTRSRCFTVDIPTSWLDRLGEDAALREPFEHRGGALAWLAARLLGEFRGGDSASPLSIEGIVLEMIGTATRSAANEQRVTPAVRRVRELIEAHFLESLSLADLGAATGRHPVYLATAFRRAYGETIGECVRRLRVDFAARAIAQSEAPLADVALAAGFASQSHLTRTFKRATGVTPAAYRKLNRGQTH